jgi:transcriptional regulator with XRE-family HTH domain
MDIRIIVAWNLRRLRVEAGISQDDLGHQADLERAYIGHLERGTKNPTIVTLAKLAEVLQCPVKALFEEPTEGSVQPQPLRAGRRRKS